MLMQVKAATKNHAETWNVERLVCVLFIELMVLYSTQGCLSQCQLYPFNIQNDIVCAIF